MSLERNISPKTPSDIEAEGMSHDLSVRDRSGDINLGYPRYVEAEVMRRWPEEGYGTPQTFVDKSGNPIIIARHEDAELYDAEGVIKPGIDASYRIYLEDETREVSVPKELAGEASQTLGRGDVVVYKISERAVLELILRHDAARFEEDLEWLRSHFGDSLAIVRPPLSVSRLAADGKAVGIAMDTFPAFDESDF